MNDPPASDEITEGIPKKDSHPRRKAVAAADAAVAAWLLGLVVLLCL